MIFFRLIKLKAYFKDSNMYTPSTEDELFKWKTKKKWRPDKNHHTVETYIEANKNALKTKKQNNKKTKQILQQFNKRRKKNTWRIGRSKWYNYYKSRYGEQ